MQLFTFQSSPVTGIIKGLKRSVGRLQLAALCGMSLIAGPLAAMPFSLQNNRWELLTLPANPTNKTVSVLFGDDLPMADFQRTWSVFTFDSRTQDYNELVASDSLDQGQGFWIIQRTGNTVDLDIPAASPAADVSQSAACPSSAGCFSYALATQTNTAMWSLAGAPFSRPTNIAEVRVVSADANSQCVSGCNLNDAAAAELTGNVLWRYDSSKNTYQRLGINKTLPVWHAFWLSTHAQSSTSPPTLLLPKPAEPTVDIELRNQALGRGMNVGNALDAPNEGDWGWSLEANHFDIIADAGFDSVRVPVSWSTHAAAAPPYTIDKVFFERVDWVLEQTARTGLVTVLDVHHYLELMDNPAGHRARFLSIWRQIAERYADRPETVYFELLNEPTESFTEDPSIWNRLLVDALEIVRRSNPTRPVLIGPVGWNAIEFLDQLVLPDDPNIIVPVHFYSPFEFTHQGADWVDPIPPLGPEWFGDVAQLGSTFQNWSWFTETTTLPGALQVSYDRQYAAFTIHSTSPLSAQTLAIELSGTASLAVMCGKGDNYTEVDRISHTGAAWGSYTADVSQCENGSENFALENQLAGKQTIKLRGGELCSTSGCQPVISTEGEAVQDLLAVASRWGDANARPIYVGEFGAHFMADMASRARYIKHTQNSIHALGMSSSHWGFASTFAAYDLANGRWHAPLLNALIPPR